MSTKEMILTTSVLLVLFGAPFIIMQSKNKMVVNYNCQQTIDSLNGEISTLQIDNGRYEIILDRVNELDSSVYERAMKNIE